MKRREQTLWNGMKQHGILVVGGVISVLLLMSFVGLRGAFKESMDLPGHFVWIAVVPVAVCLVAGGYIKKFEVTEKGFVVEVPSDVKKAQEVTPGGKLPEGVAEAPWQIERASEYKRTGGLFLVHVYEPSDEPGQQYEVFVYLVRHQKDSLKPMKIGLSDVNQVEYYFGRSWGDRIFTVVNSGNNVLGIRTHAYGTFLATCRVTFRDKEKPPILLHRYLDCEMLN